jgi:hypothetical protein
MWKSPRFAFSLSCESKSVFLFLPISLAKCIISPTEFLDNGQDGPGQISCGLPPDPSWPEILSRCLRHPSAERREIGLVPSEPCRASGSFRQIPLGRSDGHRSRSEGPWISSRSRVGRRHILPRHPGWSIGGRFPAKSTIEARDGAGPSPGRAISPFETLPGGRIAEGSQDRSFSRFRRLASRRASAFWSFCSARSTGAGRSTKSASVGSPKGLFP